MKRAGKLDPRFKAAVESAYRRGLADGEKRKSRYCRNKMLRALARQFDAKAKQGITAAYDLGVMDGEKSRCRVCSNTKIAKLQTANRHLYEALLQEDRNNPVPGIVVSLAEAELIIDRLQKGIRNVPMAQLLKRRVEHQIRSFENALAELGAMG